MSATVNHYEVLSLPPSPPESSKLTTTEISKAFRAKALTMHPDKCPDDPNATSKFQQLKSSYEILVNPTSRKIFDDHLRSNTTKRKKGRPQSQSEEEERLRKKMAEAEEEELRRRIIVSDDDGVLEARANNWRDFLKQKCRSR